MKEFVAAVIAAIFSLFGIHHAPAHTASRPPSAQVASAVSAVEDPFHPVSSDPGASTRQSTTIDSIPSPQTTIVKQPARLNDVSRSGGYITQPLVERIIQSPPMTSGLILGASTDGTAAKLSDLQDQINALSHAPQLVFVPSFSGPAASTPVSTATFASSQKIDQLTNVTLNNPTINGISGLTAADVPALNYLSLAGGFLSGGLSIGGNSTTTGTAYFTGNLTGANIFGTTSSTTILASGATTPRALGDCAADVINVKSFGAKGNGIADDSAATNAAISYIRNANDAAGGGAMNKYELYFPQGNYLISSTINLTCMSDPNATSGGGLLQDDGCRPNGGSVQVGGNHSVLKIVGDGATISCATTGAPCIDGLGSRYIQIHGLKVFGVCNASEPTWGVQFGMTVAGVGGNDWYFNSVVFTGCYINAAYYNRNSEVMVIDGNSNFQNLDSTHTFATSTGPYVAVWNGGNHWQVTSSFVTTIFTQDAPTTFNDNTVTGSFRSGNSNVGGIWIYGTRRLRFNDSYFISGQGSCVNIYFGASDAGSASTVTDGTPEDAQFDIHCEGTLSKTFLIMGPQSHPIIKNLHYNDHALAPGNASASIFALDPGVTALTLQNVDINMAGTATANTVWDTPSAYTVSGNIYLPANGHTTWTAPGSWKGCVWIGTNSPSCGGLTITNGFIDVNNTALSNLDIGFSAGAATTTTGTNNVALGSSALALLTNGSTNVAVGNFAGRSTTVATAQTLIGYQAGINSNANNITYVGAFAGLNHTGVQNVGIGVQALPANGAGALNTAVGFQTGFADTSGAKNIFLGAYAASTTATGSNNIALGYDIALPVADGSNQLNIGNLIFGTGINGEGTNLSTGSIGIGTTSPAYKFTVDNTGVAGVVAGFENSSGECTINPTGSSVNCSSDITLKKNIVPIIGEDALAGVRALEPVFFNWNTEDASSSKHSGFIAQSVQGIFPDLVSVGSNGKLLLNCAGFTTYIVKAVQQLAAKISDLADTVAGFAERFVTKELVAINVTADHIQFKTANGDKLCLGSTCITESQLAAIITATGQSPAATVGSPSAPAASDNATNTPPVITIAGENPAHIRVGDTYADLGATITGPQADLNLGIKTFLNGTLVSDIVLDTSTTTTGTIDYVVTDQNGLTSTSTRTVFIEPVAPSTPQSLPITDSPPLVPTTDSATSTATNISQ